MQSNRKLIFCFILISLTSAGRGEERTLEIKPVMPPHDFQSTKKRIAKGNEPTLADTLSLYLWIRENDACALCEKDRAKRVERVDKALNEMKTEGNATQKAAAERLLRERKDAVAAYLSAVERARETARTQISDGMTTFDWKHPDVFVDQLLFEKSKGSIAVLPNGATEFASQLGGERQHSSDLKVERKRRDNEQWNLDVSNATHSWTEALKRM